MPSGLLSLLLLLIVGFFIAVYKRQMIIKMFSLNVATMADEFRNEVEHTADKAVKRLEEQMTHLEYLLEEADNKIASLEEKLRQAELQQTQTASESDVELSPLHLDILQSADSNHAVNSSASQHSLLPKDHDAVWPVSNQTLRQFVPQTADTAKEKREQVINMHRQGFNVLEIAQATSMGKGEVMLLLELHKS